MIKKIISGGQTGVDQAALDAAIDCEAAYGGWLPAGRKTEDGPLSEKYAMDEMLSSSYADRTRKNVESADATLIISRGPLSGGSGLTMRIALSINKPCLHVDLAEAGVGTALSRVRCWLQRNKAEIVNVAGPRASSDKTIYNDAYAIVAGIINRKLSSHQDEGGSAKTSLK